MIKVKEYEEFIVAMAKTPLDDKYDVIGLNGEAGECAEWVKKAVFRGDKSHTEEMLMLELGDVLHYATRMTLNHGWTLKQIMQANVDKITERRSK